MTEYTDYSDHVDNRIESDNDPKSSSKQEFQETMATAAMWWDENEIDSTKDKLAVSNKNQ